ncbi:hypothetical protein HanIR_Chr12g0603571 [Helianthus annuus]|nr:hypothetical protein HanIR_Chr12g0603571 [Helianthus annuus]
MTRRMVDSLAISAYRNMLEKDFDRSTIRVAALNAFTLRRMI